MFRFLNNLIKFFFFLVLILLSYLTVSDMFMYTTYYEDIIYQIEPYKMYAVYLGIAAMIYILIVLIAIIEKLFKKKKVIKSTSSNGNVEVSVDTINDISKKFLESKSIVKNAKVEAAVSFSSLSIYSNVETFNVENLNVKLSEIQNELKEYVDLMTGIKVKSVVIKIVKINSETVIENSEIVESLEISEEVNEIKEEIKEDGEY
ncbi:MAG: alkaline shock response membrane anchor protein AmaP [Streptobacillus sp.]